MHYKAAWTLWDAISSTKPTWNATRGPCHNSSEGVIKTRKSRVSRVSIQGPVLLVFGRDLMFGLWILRQKILDARELFLRAASEHLIVALCTNPSLYPGPGRIPKLDPL